MPSTITKSTRKPFSMDAFKEFLGGGWIFSTQSRDFPETMILVGWGEFTSLFNPGPRIDVVRGAADQESDSAVIFAPNFILDGKKNESQDDRPWKWTKFWDLLPRHQFAELILKATEDFANEDHSSISWREPEFSQFQARFNLIHDGLQKGHLKKAVPVVFSTATMDMSPSRHARILRHLVQLPNSLALYGFWNFESTSGLKEGMIGATPEMLFSIKSANQSGHPPGSAEQSQLRTSALAGTKAKLSSDLSGQMVEQKALLNDPKERAEHQFVIDDIANVLAPIGKVKVGTTHVVELPTLYHLKTEIYADLSANSIGVTTPAESLVSFIRRLHPTPALGVDPRALGLVEMARWDDLEFRRRFGAPFGIVAPGICDCVVAIRNIQWQDRDIQLGSGCGIVRASEVEREWQELKLKRDSVKRMLGL